MSSVDELPPEDPTFGSLGQVIARFANHTRKYMRASIELRSTFEQMAEWSEGAAPLCSSPENPASALRAVDKFARTMRLERQRMFGGYFAHHYLREQAELSLELARRCAASDPTARAAACRNFVEESEASRRKWVAALLDLTIAAAAPDLSKRDYAALNVGALTDHEDVDLAIVVASEEAGEALTRGFASVGKTFLRYASKIHSFLGEGLARPSFGAPIEHFERIIHDPELSVVSVMQLLGAEYLCGNPALARDLEERVITPFYVPEGSPIIHEAFLRSVRTELSHYQEPALLPGVLAPKKEIYFSAKLTTTAVRVIEGVRETSVLDALGQVAERDVENTDAYVMLADAFAQSETLRALSFLYVARGDRLDLSDPAVSAAAKEVAEVLGLGDSARRSSETRLRGAYTDFRARGLRAVATLTTKINDHVGRVSAFRGLLERGRYFEASEENTAGTLLKDLEQHRRGVFWDDVVELVLRDRSRGPRFVDELKRLDDDELGDMAQGYLELMASDPAAMLELLVAMATLERSRPSANDATDPRVLSVFWETTLRTLSEHRDALERLTERLDAESRTETLFQLAESTGPARLARLAELIETADPSTRGRRVAHTIRAVILLVHHHSHAVGRVIGRVLGRTPEFIDRLGVSTRLKDLARELQTRAVREHEPGIQVDLLGDSFDVAALRTILISVLEGTPAAGDMELTAAVDQYVRELFKAYFRDVRELSPMFASYRPGAEIALYATGAYGRGEAFGADWDYFAVVEHDDRSLKKFLGKVLQRVSTAMTRRGLLPHNRLAQQFNSFVVSIPELKAYLSSRTPETFIDEAEILEARFFLGDPAVSRSFNDQVRRMVTKTNATLFIQDTLEELRAGRRLRPRGIDLKLGPGGLRENHLLWLAIRVFARLPGPLVPELLPRATEALPECRGDLRFLMVANTELRRARDLYRLVVAFDNVVDPERIVSAAKDLKPLQLVGARGDYRGELIKLMRTCATRIDRVAAAIAKRLSTSSEPTDGERG